MKSKWKVSSTYAGGERFYQVYRLRDVNEVDHSGNREIAGTFDDEARAQEYADAKNRLEEDE
jgi:hypothetical protein